MGAGSLRNSVLSSSVKSSIIRHHESDNSSLATSDFSFWSCGEASEGDDTQPQFLSSEFDASGELAADNPLNLARRVLSRQS